MLQLHLFLVNYLKILFEYFKILKKKKETVKKINKLFYFSHVV